MQILLELDKGVGIPTPELELLLVELQRDPTLFISEMADFLFNPNPSLSC